MDYILTIQLGTNVSIFIVMRVLPSLFPRSRPFSDFFHVVKSNVKSLEYKFMYSNACQKIEYIGNTRLHEEKYIVTVQLNFWLLACFSLNNLLVFTDSHGCHLCNRNRVVVAKFLECKKQKNHTHVPFQNQQNFYKVSLVLSKFVL